MVEKIKIKSTDDVIAWFVFFTIKMISDYTHRQLVRLFCIKTRNHFCKYITSINNIISANILHLLISLLQIYFVSG